MIIREKLKVFISILLFFAAVTIILICIPTKAIEAGADTILEVEDYTDIQEYIEDNSDIKFDFSETVTELIREEDSFTIESIVNRVINAIKDDIKRTIKVLTTILSMVILLAVFKNISNTFRNGQASEAGFFVTYLVFFSAVSVSVYDACSVASDAIHSVIDFTKALIPAYTMAVAVATGSSTSTAVYEGILFTIAIAEMVLLRLLIPLVSIYMLIVLADRINGESSLLRLAELLSAGICFLQKTILGIILGIGAVRGLLAPAIDGIKRNSLFKLSSAIPGIGGLINGITETVMGASSLIRNAVGIAGIIVLLSLCLIPLAKLSFYALCYKLGCALIQPVSDTRITEALNCAGTASLMLLKIVFSCLLMFVLSIAVALEGLK